MRSGGSMEGGGKIGHMKSGGRGSWRVLEYTASLPVNGELLQLYNFPPAYYMKTCLLRDHASVSPRFN